MLDVHVREHLRCTLNLLARSGENFLNFHGRVRIPCPTIYEDTEFVVWNQFLPACNTIRNAHVQCERVPCKYTYREWKARQCLAPPKGNGVSNIRPISRLRTSNNNWDAPGDNGIEKSPRRYGVTRNHQTKHRIHHLPCILLGRFLNGVFAFGSLNGDINFADIAQLLQPGPEVI